MYALSKSRSSSSQTLWSLRNVSKQSWCIWIIFNYFHKYVGVVSSLGMHAVFRGLRNAFNTIPTGLSLTGLGVYFSHLNRNRRSELVYFEWRMLRCVLLLFNPDAYLHPTDQIQHNHTLPSDSKQYPRRVPLFPVEAAACNHWSWKQLPRQTSKMRVEKYPLSAASRLLYIVTRVASLLVVTSG